MLLRRLRGLAISSLLWAVPWAGFGVLMGLAFKLGLVPDWVIQGPPDFPAGIIGALGFTGAIIGGINGLVFGGILILAERRQGLAEVPGWRAGGWGMLATGGTVLAMSGSLAVAAVCGLVGFGAGAAALRLAKRGAASADLALGESDATV